MSLPLKHFKHSKHFIGRRSIRCTNGNCGNVDHTKQNRLPQGLTKPDTFRCTSSSFPAESYITDLLDQIKTKKTKRYPNSSLIPGSARMIYCKSLGIFLPPNFSFTKLLERTGSVGVTHAPIINAGKNERFGNMPNIRRC